MYSLGRETALSMAEKNVWYLIGGFTIEAFTAFSKKHANFRRPHAAIYVVCDDGATGCTQFRLLVVLISLDLFLRHGFPHFVYDNFLFSFLSLFQLLAYRLQCQHKSLDRAWPRLPVYDHAEEAAVITRCIVNHKSATD